MPPPRRPAAIALSLALHAAALAAFVLRPEPPPMAAGAPDLIPVVMVAPARPALIPIDFGPMIGGDFAFDAPAPEPPPPAAPPDPSPDTTPVDCALADDVRAALEAEGPRAALARIPAHRRSVAGAVMLWDGRWVRDGALAEPTVARPIRRAVADAVRAADPACAAAPVTGPVVLILPEAAGSLVVVVGSGTWRWADLATSG